MERLRLSRPVFIKGIKIAVGSTAAIFLSELLGLDFAGSSGIITLLTILDSRVDTFKLSLQRILSFVFSMTVAYVISRTPIGDAAGFLLYIAIVVEFSYLVKWDSSISTNAVFGTHIFLSAESVIMNRGMMLNELGLLVTGTTMAIVMNLRMPKLEKELSENMDYAEKETKRLFRKMIINISKKEKLKETLAETEALTVFLERAEKTAVLSMHNSDDDNGNFFLGYFTMRKNQCDIMIHFIKCFSAVNFLPENSERAIAFLHEVADNFSITDDVDKRLRNLNLLLDEFKAYPLPTTRDDFETRAILFHVLNEMEEFLNLKKEYRRYISPEQIHNYFGVGI